MKKRNFLINFFFLFFGYLSLLKTYTKYKNIFYNNMLVKKILQIAIYFVIIYLYMILFKDFYLSIDNKIYKNLFIIFFEGSLILAGGLIFGKLIGVIGFSIFEYIAYIIADYSLILFRLIVIGFWVAIYILWKQYYRKGFIAGLLFHFNWNLSIEYGLNFLIFINMIIIVLIISLIFYY